MLEIIDGIIWLKMFGTSFILFCSFLYLGKITDGLIKRKLNK